MEKDLISVIIPVYNVELYVGKCLDSVVQQTYRNMEIIVVDDGSTDSSGQICNEYKKKDSRIQVIHKKNEGLSASRNLAISLAKGKFITCIDSDDYIAENYIGELYNVLTKYDADISVCRFLYTFGNKEDKRDGKNDEFVYSKVEALKVLFGEKEFGHYAHQKLYKSEIIKKHPYPVGKAYEDVATTYKMFADANRVAYTQKQLYFYRLRPGSIISSDNGNKFDVIEHVDHIQDDIADCFPEVLPYTEQLKAFYYLHTLARLPKGEKYQSLRLKINSYLKENRFRLLASKLISSRLKVQILISFLGEDIYKKVWSAKEKNKNKIILENMKESNTM